MRSKTSAILVLLPTVTPVAAFTAAVEQTVPAPETVVRVDQPAEVPQPGVVKSTGVARRLASVFRIDPQGLRAEDRREVICGLTVVRKSPDLDPRIILPRDRGANLGARRVEPDTCRPADRDKR